MADRCRCAVPSPGGTVEPCDRPATRDEGLCNPCRISCLPRGRLARGVLAGFVLVASVWVAVGLLAVKVLR